MYHVDMSSFVEKVTERLIRVTAFFGTESGESQPIPAFLTRRMTRGSWQRGSLTEQPLQIGLAYLLVLTLFTSALFNTLLLEPEIRGWYISSGLSKIEDNKLQRISIWVSISPFQPSKCILKVETISTELSKAARVNFRNSKSKV